ncbi:MAG: acyl-CoA dehydrogenase [Cytophagales bacterium]|nr:acyl-CoA dehydrogenase [Cytophagales bacterium]
MIPRTLFTEEHDLVRKSISDFFQKEIVPFHDQWETDGHISRDAWLKTGEAGFLCTEIPEEYGGSGLNFLYSTILIEELCKTGCTGPGFAVHSDIVTPYILHQGTEAQKKKWLPKMAAGEVISAIAMSEPGAGSDLQAIKTTAIKQGDDYIVNGSKTFITNGYMSDLVVVVVKTDPKAEAKGISLLLMESGMEKPPLVPPKGGNKKSSRVLGRDLGGLLMEGFTKGKPLKKIGMKAQDTCELFFDNVKVPQTNLLGKEGEGFAYLMQELPQERLLVGIIAVVVAETALEKTIQYTKDRAAFGRPIAKFQNTRFKLAEMATEIQIGRTFVDKCIELHLKHELDAPTAAMVKYAMSDLQCKVVDECLQFHGGYGYMWEYWIARAYADSRAQRIYAGANEIMKEIIARKIIDNS